MRKLSNKDIDNRLIGRNIARLDDYINCRSKIDWKCLICNYVWNTTSNTILYSDEGCPMCGGNIKLTNERIDQKLKYSFLKRLENYINNSGCPECYDNSRKLTNDEVDRRLIKTNIKRLGSYKNARIKIQLQCIAKDCNYIWYALPNGCLNQDIGCPQCAKYYTTSKEEIAWLNYRCIPNDKDHRQVSIKVKNKGKGYSVDGYDPITNTIYEFYGDYWHGNPKVFDQNKIHPLKCETYGELYAKTIQKEQILKAAGYNVITIWENDWKKVKE